MTRAVLSKNRQNMAGLIFARPALFGWSEGRLKALNNCCKEWALKVTPRQSWPGDQLGFEEEHACPTCQESYLLWFTSIGNPHAKCVQIVPVTIKPAKGIVHSSGYMHSMENSLETTDRSSSKH
jgi:hypothetical protein